MSYINSECIVKDPKTGVEYGKLKDFGKQELLWENSAGWAVNSSITLNDDVTKYHTLYILMSGEGTYISVPIIPVELVTNTSTGYIRGGGVNVVNTNYIYTYAINATYQYANPRVLTLVNCGYIRHNPASNHNAFVSSTPVKIIGVR